MIRKMAVMLAVSLFPALALAEPTVYGGLNIATSNGHISMTDVSGNRVPFDLRGVLGGLFVGMGSELVPHGWLAAELGGYFDSARTGTKNVTAAGGSTTGRFRIRHGWHGSLVPGLLFTPQYMLYGRIGLGQARFEYKQPIPPSGASSVTDNTLVAGMIYGAGFQFQLNYDWHLRIEYDRLVYHHFTTFNNRVSPTDNQLHLGLVYGFGMPT